MTVTVKEIKNGEYFEIDCTVYRRGNANRNTHKVECREFGRMRSSDGGFGKVVELDYDTPCVKVSKKDAEHFNF